MKKILVPTDFSKQADNALHVAAQLAKRYKAGIYLLHLLELPLSETDAIGTQSDLPEAVFYMNLAKKRFKEVMSRAFLKGIKIHETVEFNKAFEGINEVSTKQDIDLVVMGSKGTSGIKEMFIGSNTEKVVRTSDIPVLVIKNKHKDLNLGNFVFATNFKKKDKIACIRAAKLATLFGSTIHFVIVNTANRFLKTKTINKRTTAFFKNAQFQNYSIAVYNDETIELGILNYAKDINANVIGIGTHGRRGLAHFFNGSVSESIVNHAKRPVLTFKI